MREKDKETEAETDKQKERGQKIAILSLESNNPKMEAFSLNGSQLSFHFKGLGKPKKCLVKNPPPIFLCCFFSVLSKGPDSPVKARPFSALWNQVEPQNCAFSSVYTLEQFRQNYSSAAAMSSLVKPTQSCRMMEPASFTAVRKQRGRSLSLTKTLHTQPVLELIKSL